ncbi:MAG: hypothetical protein HFG45_05410 [Oscillospiraceae bacterium]|jgi:hypothetical protein|nr:hypothetical protein [Oscillospiraceae bacterium]
MMLRFRRPIALLLCICALFCLASCKKEETAGPTPTPEVPDWENPYTDLTEDMWVYPYVARLGDAGVFSGDGTFEPDALVTGTELYGYLQTLAGALNVTVPDMGEPSAESLTRADICVILANFARGCELSLHAWHLPRAHREALDLSSGTQNAVTACAAAGIITDDDGSGGHSLQLDQTVTRAQCAVMLCKLLDVDKSRGETPVDFSLNAYNDLYAALSQDLTHVPECDPVDASYFDDAVFVGDSVSLRLQYYCTSNGALGDTTFLCSGSLSATNALWAVGSESVHPSYQGKKMLIEDGIAACGAKKAYIMLGMNNISFGVDNATADMVTLMDRILEKAPDVTLIIQAVTPMTAASRIRSNALNNEKIDEYNEAMRQICQERGWYFLDVNTQFKDENNDLVRSYCSDADEMGIHFSTAAAEIWVNYLKTHVPAELLDA